MRNRLVRTTSRRAQHGAAGTLAAIWIIIAIAALGAIDVGNLFFARRSLQSVVDLAASAGSQVADTACTRAQNAALGTANINGFVASAAGNDMTTTCGSFNAQTNPAPDYYVPNTQPVNAVKVIAHRTVNAFFIGPPQIVTASAVARTVNIGAFTLGTTLASIGQGPLNGLLNALLGTNLNLSLASYQGLANTRVKISDLVAAAGVSTVDQLLAAKLTAAQIANLMLGALQTTTVANASLSTAIGTMQTIASAVVPGGQTIALGNTSTTPGILALNLANTQSALNATVSPFDALFVAAEIAQAGKAAVNVAGGLTLPGVVSTKLSVQVIQPPVLAVGEAIKDASGNWRTFASTAQVRAFLDISVASLSLGLIPGQSGSSLIHLPLYVEVSPGKAWLTGTQCVGAPAARTSSVLVQTGLARTCIGDIPASMGATWSCSQPATLVNAGILTIKLAANLNASVPVVNAPTLTFDGIAGNADDYQTTAAPAGATLSAALSGLGTSLQQNGALSITSPLTLLNPILALLSQTVLNLLIPPLALLLPALDSVLTPVLNLLGAQVGQATVHDLSLSCGESQLSY